MCFYVFVGSLLLTETGRLFPSLMLSSEVGCQHLSRQRNYDAGKKISCEGYGKADLFYTTEYKHKELVLELDMI